jgi:hypothetical protein
MRPLNQRIFDEAVKKMNDLSKRHNALNEMKGKICNLCGKSHWNTGSMAEIREAIDCIERAFGDLKGKLK